MDKSRRVEKGVSGELLDITTNTVFSFCTYPLDSVVSGILHNGLFQRSVFLYKNITDEEDEKIFDHVQVKLYNETWKENFNRQEYISLLIRKLKNIKIWYEENKHKIKFFKEAEDHSKRIWKAYSEDFNLIVKADRDIMRSIRLRMSINLEKVIVLNAISNMKTHIDYEDVNELFNMFKVCLDSIKIFLGQIKSVDKQKFAILNILKSGSKSSMTVHDELKDKVGMKSINARCKLIRQMKELDLISEYNEGKYTMLRLTQKGLEEIE
jgi:hypothetical protein